MPLVVSYHEELRNSLGNSSPTKLLGMLGQPTGGVLESCCLVCPILESILLDWIPNITALHSRGKPEESTQQTSN